MYPILYRLCDNHHISDYSKRIGRRQIRVYYHLEESGRKYLEELLIEYHSFLEVISFLLDSNPGDIYSLEEK